jgi:hypothetical protein
MNSGVIGEHAKTNLEFDGCSMSQIKRINSVDRSRHNLKKLDL